VRVLFYLTSHFKDSLSRLIVLITYENISTFLSVHGFVGPLQRPLLQPDVRNFDSQQILEYKGSVRLSLIKDIKIRIFKPGSENKTLFLNCNLGSLVIETFVYILHKRASFYFYF
jgi:hypothetical protein